jgi:hypothetical protein
MAKAIPTSAAPSRCDKGKLHLLIGGLPNHHWNTEPFAHSTRTLLFPAFPAFGAAGALAAPRGADMTRPAQAKPLDIDAVAADAPPAGFTRSNALSSDHGLPIPAKTHGLRRFLDTAKWDQDRKSEQ